jgi:hypothetical protein
MASNRGAVLAGWQPRRGRILLMIGLLLFGLAAWRFAGRAAFADRAVIATAVIEEVAQGPFLAAEDVRRSLPSTPLSGTRWTARLPGAALPLVAAAVAPARPGISGATRSPSPTTHGRAIPSILPAASLAGIPCWTGGVLALLFMGVVFLVAAAGDMVAGP